MKESRYFFVPDAENQTELPTDEAMHAMRVLRLKSGDELFLMDGVGNYFRAQVTVAATHHCYYEVLEKLPVVLIPSLAASFPAVEIARGEQTLTPPKCDSLA